MDQDTKQPLPLFPYSNIKYNTNTIIIGNRHLNRDNIITYFRSNLKNPNVCFISPDENKDFLSLKLDTDKGRSLFDYYESQFITSVKNKAENKQTLFVFYDTQLTSHILDICNDEKYSCVFVYDDVPVINRSWAVKLDYVFYFTNNILSRDLFYDQFLYLYLTSNNQFKNLCNSMIDKWLIIYNEPYYQNAIPFYYDFAYSKDLL